MPVPVATVLLVDDDIFVRAYTAELLKQGGFHVLEASDASEALIHFNKRQPDIVVTDVIMPGLMTGLELAKTLRASSPALPIIYISGNSSDIDSTETLADGINFLQKPFESDELLNLINRLLR